MLRSWLDKEEDVCEEECEVCDIVLKGDIDDLGIQEGWSHVADPRPYEPGDDDYDRHYPCEAFVCKECTAKIDAIINPAIESLRSIGVHDPAWLVSVWTGDGRLC